MVGWQLNKTDQDHGWTGADFTGNKSEVGSGPMALIEVGRNAGITRQLPRYITILCSAPLSVRYLSFLPVVPNWIHTSLFPKFIIQQFPVVLLNYLWTAHSQWTEQSVLQFLFTYFSSDLGFCSTINIYGISECLHNVQNNNNIKYLWSTYYMSWAC